MNPTAPTEPSAPTEGKHTTCYGCACGGGVRVHRPAGEARDIGCNTGHARKQEPILAEHSSGVMKQRLHAPLTMLLALPAAAGAQVSPTVRAEAFVLQDLGLLAQRCSLFAQAKQPQNLNCQAIA